MAASSGYRFNGCIVTSQAASGFLHKSIKLPASERVFRYSGRYLPACLISQIGVYSVGCRRNALKKTSFRTGIKSDTKLSVVGNEIKKQKHRVP